MYVAITSPYPWDRGVTVNLANSSSGSRDPRMNSNSSSQNLLGATGGGGTVSGENSKKKKKEIRSHSSLEADCVTILKSLHEQMLGLNTLHRNLITNNLRRILHQFEELGRTMVGIGSFREGNFTRFCEFLQRS